MTAKELIKAVADAGPMSPRQAEQAVLTVAHCIVTYAKAGQVVVVPGLGKFKVNLMAARTARNPKTGEPVEVPAKRKLAFKAAKGVLEG